MTSSQKQILLQSMDIIRRCVGDKWLERRSELWRESDWKHPIISTYHFAKRSLDKDSDVIMQDEHATRLVFWAYSIQAVGSRVKWDQLSKWLRDYRGCEKALYVLQVASLYLSQGFEVEFNDKPPFAYDFHVFCADGIVPVECKKKGESARDQIARQNWQYLERRLNRMMNRLNKSAFVWIESLKDLTLADIKFLEQQVESMITMAGTLVRDDITLFSAIPEISGETVRTEEQLVEQLACGDKFFIVMQEVRPSNEAQRGSFDQIMIFYDQPAWGTAGANRPIRFMGSWAIGPLWRGVPQHACLQCKFMVVDNDTKEVRNFRAFGFKSHEIRDYTRTVLNSFTHVRRSKQLPPDAPGLIFVDLVAPSAADGVGADPMALRFHEVEQALAHKLRGAYSRRVNAVVLTCTSRCRTSCDYGWCEAIDMRARVIIHKNPRQCLPTGFFPLGRLSDSDLNFRSAIWNAPGLPLL